MIRRLQNDRSSFMIYMDRIEESLAEVLLPNRCLQEAVTLSDESSRGAYEEMQRIAEKHSRFPFFQKAVEEFARYFKHRET